MHFNVEYLNKRPHALTHVVQKTPQKHTLLSFFSFSFEPVVIIISLITKKKKKKSAFVVSICVFLFVLFREDHGQIAISQLHVTVTLCFHYFYYYILLVFNS
jgi:hypothetical protein